MAADDSNRTMNKLWYGDNLTLLQDMAAESVDLIYLDPPFNSNRSYNLLYRNTTGLPVPEQIEAFCDAWDFDYEKAEMAKNLPLEMKKKGIDEDVVQFWYFMIKALRSTNPRMLAYLIYMTVRLIEMHRVLRPAGSLYLHCDPTASHYIKILLDGIFGHKQFRNEIIWHYTGWNKKLANRFESRHDVILFYAKKENAGKFHAYSVPWESEAEYIRTRKQKVLKDENGEPYVLSDGGGGKRVRRYIKEAMAYGSPVDDVWDIDKINNSSKEKLGYPTQKPLALLDRIITASSTEGDIVFDPFCGCGTTIESAIRNNRQWIGCDIAIHAIKLIQDTRLKKYGLIEDRDFEIKGIPQSEEQARFLADKDKHQFQHWAVERTGGFCSNKYVADGGVDGKIYFEAEGTLYNMVVSVKGGAVHPSDVRDLRGVLDREEENTKMGGLISLNEPTKAMRQEADSAGYFEYQGVKYQRIQLLTIKEIFEGKIWHCPSMVKIKRKEGGQMYFSI